VAAVELGGPRLHDEGGGLYRSEGGGATSWAFATTLCPVDAHDVVADALASVGGPPDAVGAPHGGPPFPDLDLRANVDDALGVVVLRCTDRCAPTDSGRRGPAAEAARRALGACLVAELCGADRIRGGLR
jgi:hypothetical protein